MINLQPTLIGEFICLRPLKKSDFQELFQAASDPLIWEMHPQPDRYKLEVFKIFFEEALQSNGAFVILDKKTSEITGGINTGIQEVTISYDPPKKSYIYKIDNPLK